MSELRIEGLSAKVDGSEILRGIDLVINSGEVHAVMGPNGSGKSTLSHVIMGRPGYEVTGGSVTLDGVDLLALAPWERAQAGLFLAMQHPTEIDGVTVADVVRESARAGDGDTDAVAQRLAAEAQALGLEADFLTRGINVDMSGGEKKRNETLQLAALAPKFAILDEIDSGLDVDALAVVSARVEAATNNDGLGVLAITHFSRLLEVLVPDKVHVLAYGRIQETGGAELANELEETGYDRWTNAPAVTAVSIGGLGSKKKPEPDPFADPLA